MLLLHCKSWEETIQSFIPMSDVNCVGFVDSFRQVRASTVVHIVTNLPATRGPGSDPGSGRSPGEGNSNPLQYSCLESSMDRAAWWATVHGVTKSRTL